jgi:hypothetical protein
MSITRLVYTLILFFFVGYITTQVMNDEDKSGYRTYAEKLNLIVQQKNKK